MSNDVHYANYDVYLQVVDRSLLTEPISAMMSLQEWSGLSIGQVKRIYEQLMDQFFNNKLNMVYFPYPFDRFKSNYPRLKIIEQYGLGWVIMVRPK